MHVLQLQPKTGNLCQFCDKVCRCSTAGYTSYMRVHKDYVNEKTPNWFGHKQQS